MSSRIKYCKKRDVYYQSLGTPQRLLVAVTLIMTAFYLQWRIDTFNPDAILFSLLLYAAELYGVCMVLIHLFCLERLTVRTPPDANPYSSVDVFITVYNEHIDIVRRTAIAAKKLDFPAIVYILDDGRREELRELAEKLECQYITRKNNKHAKAGNLNNALKNSTGEFIAIFDVDHAPKRSFLNRTLGYFVDEKVAFVQTPQIFYNLDSFQHRGNKEEGYVWTEQSRFFNLAQRGKDYWNSAFFCGSCAVMRRSALERVGGFATETVTEDMHTSLRLHKAGFKSIYHAEALAFGIAPAHMSTFLKQRKRWGTGNIQSWRSEGILFAPGLSLAQRINYFSSVIVYFDGWQRLVYYLIPGIVLVTGVPPLVAEMKPFLVHFAPYMVLHWFMMIEVSRGYGRAVYEEQYNMTLFHIFCSSTLAWIKPSQKFEVTHKGPARLSRTWYAVWPQIGILIFNVLAIVYGIQEHYRNTQHLTEFALWFNIFWGAVCIALAIGALKFALYRAKFKRNDYRFSLPLKAEIDFKVDGLQQRRPIQLKNISGTGAMFCVDRYVYLKTGDEISGIIYLPDELSFTAHVRAVNPDPDISHECIVGCQFEWKDEQAREKLESFIYGSDLEWRVHKIYERSATPLETITFSNSARAKALSAANMRTLKGAQSYEKQRAKL